MKKSELINMIREEISRLNEMPMGNIRGKSFSDIDPSAAARAISNEYESDLDEQSWGYALNWLVQNYKLKPAKNGEKFDWAVVDKIWDILERRYGFTLDENIVFESKQQNISRALRDLENTINDIGPGINTKELKRILIGYLKDLKREMGIIK